MGRVLKRSLKSALVISFAASIVTPFLMETTVYASVQNPAYIGIPGYIDATSDSIVASTKITMGPGTSSPMGPYYFDKEPLVIHQDYGAMDSGYITGYCETTQHVNNGYNMIGTQDLSDYVSALNGNLAYIQATVPSATATAYNGAQSIKLMNFAQIVDNSGALFGPKDSVTSNGVITDTYNVQTSPWPQGSIAMANNQNLWTSGDQVSVFTNAGIASYHTAYHFEAIKVTGPNGTNWVLGSGSSNKSQMVEESGGNGGADTWTGGTPSFHYWSYKHSFSTSGWAAGSYTATFYVSDWYDRISQAGTVSFTLNPGQVVTPPATPTPSITLAADNYTPPLGQRVNLSASPVNVPPNGYVTIHDKYSGSDYYGTNWSPPETSGTQYYTAYIHDSTGTVVATSNQVQISWGAGQPPPTMTLTLSNYAGTKWGSSGYYNYQWLGKPVTATVTWTNGVVGDQIFIWNNQISNWWTGGAIAYLGAVTPFTTSGSATVTLIEYGTSPTDNVWPGQAGYEAVMENANSNPPNNFDGGSNTAKLSWIPQLQKPTVTAVNTTTNQSSTTTLVVPVGTPVALNFHDDWAMTGFNNFGGDPWSGAEVGGVYDGVFDLDNTTTRTIYSSKYTYYTEIGVNGPASSSYIYWDASYDMVYNSNPFAPWQTTGPPPGGVYTKAVIPTPYNVVTSNVPHTGHYQAQLNWSVTQPWPNYAMNFGDGHQMVAGNTVTVIWTDKPITISLTADPTTTTIMNSSTLTATINGTPDPGSYIEMVDNETGQIIGDSQKDATTFNVSVSKAYATTDTFSAYVLNDSQPGIHFADAQPISVTWTIPTLNLTANPTNLYSGQVTTLSVTQTGTLVPSTQLQIVDQTTGQTVGYSNPGDTSYTAQYVSQNAEADTFVAYLVDDVTEQQYQTSNTVQVTWTTPPFSITDAEVYHTAGWQDCLNYWNTVEHPEAPRPESYFWAGEAFLFKVKPNPTTGITAAYVTLPGLRYDSYVPAGAPLTLQIPLTLDATSGYLMGNTDFNLEPWFQYLQFGTYTATFTVTGNGITKIASVQFTVDGRWPDYWRNAQIY